MKQSSLRLALQTALINALVNQLARFAEGVRVDDARAQRQDQQQAPRGTHASVALDLQDGRGRGQNAVQQRVGDLQIIVGAPSRSARLYRPSRLDLSLRLVTKTSEEHEESVSEISLAEDRADGRARSSDKNNGVQPDKGEPVALKGADQRREGLLPSRSPCGSTDRPADPHSDPSSLPPIADRSHRASRYC